MTHNQSGASRYKVPHHGSSTSYHPRVWDELLVGGVLSLVAPYRAGVKAIPDPQDVIRIVKRSGRASINPGAVHAAMPATAGSLGASQGDAIEVARRGP